jgi:PhoH-like ATPase
MLNAALNLVRDGRNKYEKIVVFRPVNPVGGQHQDLGFLPGTLDEKLAPHAQAIYDTLGTIVGSQEAERIKRNGIIEFASISHVRGRTLANCIVICDELQNVEASTILTLISRLGVNARVFLGWDTAQRDAQYIGKYDGIYRIVKNLYGHPLFAHVNFRTSQRSKISAMVSGLLDEM